jgi:hypothetical protein
MRLQSRTPRHPFSLAQMRPVDHLSIERQHSRLRAGCRKQARIRTARSTSSGAGVKAALMTGT